MRMGYGNLSFTNLPNTVPRLSTKMVNMIFAEFVKVRQLLYIGFDALELGEEALFTEIWIRFRQIGTIRITAEIFVACLLRLSFRILLTILAIFTIWIRT